MRRLFFTQALVIAFVGAIHILALKLYLYWQFPWLDIFVHFLGGAWVALAAVWLFTIARHKATPTLVFITLVAVSIGWELFEIWGGIPREANFAFDTSLDLLMDTLGGFSGYLAAKRMTMRDTIRSHGKAQSNPS